MPKTVVIFAMLLGFMQAAMAAPPSDTKSAAALAESKVRAARKVYEGMFKDLQQMPRRLDLEQVYQWSRRWLEAQRDASDKKADQLAALQEHLDRMKSLEKLVRTLLDKGSRDITLQEAAVAEYYRLEAELWLTQAKGK